MLNLLIISDNQKTQAIRDLLRPLVSARIDLAVDSDQGLREVFDKRPAAVIIQERISGVTGESVARHIRLLLGVNAPRFILLHEGEGTGKPVPGLMEHVLELELPPAELAAKIVSLLEELCGREMRRNGPAEPSPQESIVTAVDEELQDISAPLPAEPAPRSAAPGEGAEDYAAPVAHSPLSQDVPVVPPAFSPRGEAEAEELLPPEGDGARPGSPLRVRWILAGTFMLACLITVGWYLVEDRSFLRALFGPPLPVPTATVPPPAPGGGGKTPLQRSMPAPPQTAAAPVASLPTFVPAAGRDLAFSAARPGWERYLDGACDIRLFRDQGRLRAVQVVALPGRELGEDFLRRALQEVAGSGQITVASRQQQRQHLLERGRGGEHADLLVYRTPRSRTIVAFVIALD